MAVPHDVRAFCWDHAIFHVPYQIKAMRIPINDPKALFRILIASTWLREMNNIIFSARRLRPLLTFRDHEANYSLDEHYPFMHYKLNMETLLQSKSARGVLTYDYKREIAVRLQATTRRWLDEIILNKKLDDEVLGARRAGSGLMLISSLPCTDSMAAVSFAAWKRGWRFVCALCTFSALRFVPL